MIKPVKFDKMEALIAKHRIGGRTSSPRMKKHALIKMFKDLDFNNLPDDRKWAV